MKKLKELETYEKIFIAIGVACFIVAIAFSFTTNEPLINECHVNTAC